MRNRFQKIIILLLGWLILLPSYSYATKPVTSSSCSVLILYDSCDTSQTSYDEEIAGQGGVGASGFTNFLSSAAWPYNAFGTYPGYGFNFNVVAVDVCNDGNQVANAKTYATGVGVNSVVVAAGHPAITAQNYCEVFDLRFTNLNKFDGTYPGAGVIAEDSITQADVATYDTYLQNGGGLFILGDNYYDEGAGIVDGFKTRGDDMYKLINSFSSTAIAQDDIQEGGNPASVPGGLDTATIVANPLGINTIDYNTVGLTYTSYWPGPLVTAGLSGQAFATGSYASTGYSGLDDQALVWGPAQMQAGYTGYVVYWGDTNVLNLWATGTLSTGPPNIQTNVTEIMANVVSLLDTNQTCCGATNTMTSTSTQTCTATATSTQTATNTIGNTNTETETSTSTSTNSATNTPTPSSTETATNTATNTSTNTSTNTVTSTATNTNTPTPSQTATNTATNTMTNTATNLINNTSTSTSTSTSTQTSTSTLTATSTATVTPTPATFVGIGKTVSETQAKAGDTLTYTIAVTITGPSPLNNVTITDTLPANVSFLSFGMPPAGGVTTFTGSNDQLQWTFATLSPGVYDLTYQTQLARLIQGEPTLVNRAQLVYTGGQPVTATAPVTLIGQFSISVNIYNSAGEVVKTIKVQDFSVPIDNISLSTSNTITTLQGPGSTIDILYDGVVIGTWDGSNNSNNPVANGTYRITLSSVGSSQVVTTVSQNAIVNRNITNVEADIYNSAGEVVRKLYNVITDGKGTTMTNVVLSSGVLSPGASNPSAASVTIFVQNTDTPVTLLWDGTNDASSYVSPGEYQIHIHWTNGDASTTDITKTILVLPQSGSNGKVLAEPNEIKGSTTSTIFNGAAVNGASSLKVNIYTTSGELVQALSSSLPAVGWTPNGLASGIYIASVEVNNANGGLLSRQNVKVLILH